MYDSGVKTYTVRSYNTGLVQQATVDFTTTDRFNGLLTHAIVSRNNTDPIDITVSFTADSTAEDIVIAQVLNYTQPVFGIDQNQQVPELYNRHVRVQVSGVSGGSLQIMIARRRIYLYDASDY